MLIATVAAATEERSGDWNYRVTQPMRALAQLPGVYTVDCAYIHRAVPELIENADVLIVNMVLEDEIVDAAHKRSERGQLTLFELNDEISHIPQASGLPQVRGEFHRWFTGHLASFDGVQFTTPELARRYGRYAVRYFVAGNNIDRSFVRPRVPHPGFVVGWGGSVGHQADLAEIAPVLTDWIQSKPDASLSLMCHEELAKPFWKLRPARLNHVQPSTIEDYYQWLATIDVGLAPLRWDEFNFCRSDVKWLEYSAAGIPAVVRGMEPYYNSVEHDVNGLTYQTPEEFVDALERLYNEPVLRDRLVMSAAGYVAQHRSPAEGARVRMDAYAELKGCPSWSAGEREFRALCRYGQPVGNHLALRFGAEEWATWHKMAGLDAA